MKKFIGICAILILFITGCGKRGDKEILRDLNKNIKGLKSYYIEGKMEIINNEDIYKYDVKVSFTPHLVPVIRGIQTTSHSFLKEEHEDITGDEIKKLYEKEYGKEFFIKLMDDGEIPRLSSVRGSNFVHIGGYEIDDTGRLVMLSCIDNLVKGASGQAIQNMNILLGLEENAGLRHLGLHP